MPTEQCIVDPEDRNFVTSTGHWSGAATWEPGPFGGYSGMAKITKASDPDPDSMSLVFPHINVLKKPKVVLSFIAGDFPGSGSLFLRWNLTDGVTSFTEEVIISYVEDWQAFSEIYDLPPSWNPIQSSLTFSIRRFGTYPSICVFKFISAFVIYPPRVDHLPLMGMH